MLGVALAAAGALAGLGVFLVLALTGSDGGGADRTQAGATRSVPTVPQVRGTEVLLGATSTPQTVEAAGFATAEEAIADLYGLAGAMPDCDDASLEPGELCASFDESLDDATLAFLVGEAFSEYFDRAVVAQATDGSWVVEDVQDVIYPGDAFETPQEAVYAALGYEGSAIIECNSGLAGASNPCWDAPTYHSVSDSGDLVFLFRPQFQEWYWVLVVEGGDGTFEATEVVPAEGEFELFNSPFEAPREFYTPEEAIYDHFGYMQGELLHCDERTDTSRPCFGRPATGSVTASGDLVYLFRFSGEEWQHWVLVGELPGGRFEAIEDVDVSDPSNLTPPFR